MSFSKLLWFHGLALGIYLGGGGVPVPAQGRVQRDWAKYPAVIRIAPVPEIFAIGDVHGDVQRLAKLLAGARIIDHVPTPPEKPRWIAGAAVLVMTGDLIDKGPDALGAIGFVRSLREDATRTGGQVVVLMGNHEADFLTDPDSAKVQDFGAEMRRAGLKAKDVAACRGELGEFLCSLPLATRVGDWFFSHAGSTGGRTLDQLATDLQNGVDRDGFKSSQITGERSPLAARVGDNGPGGKSWFEPESPRQSADQLLANYTAALGAAHIVQGHQHAILEFPDGARRELGEMFQWHGRLFMIDVGMSRDIDESQGAVLHIRTQAGQAEAICPSGKTTLIWDAKQMFKSGHAKPCAL